MEILCPKCSAPQREGARFCRKCGEKLPEVVEKCFCDMCGAELAPGSDFCDSCGAKLVTDEAFATSSEAVGNPDTAFTDVADAWGDTLASLTAKEEEESLSSFDYERLPDGTFLIKGSKNAYALTVNIPEKVSVIAESAFKDSDMLELTLPEGLVRIEKRAFFGCKNLTKVTLPKSILKLGDEAFAECHTLEITISPSIRIIGKNVIRGTKAEKLEAERLAREKEIQKRQRWHDNLAAASSSKLDSPAEYGYEDKEAFDWLLELCEVGNVAARIILAKCHFFGIGTVQSTRNAYNMIGDMYFSRSNSTVVALAEEIWRHYKAGRQ